MSRDLGDSRAESADSRESSESSAESRADSSTTKESPKSPRFRPIIDGAKGLSLGISIVVAILLGIGAGIAMQKLFDAFWLLFLGVFWGVAAAILNVYKAYKEQQRDFEKLAKDPKYSHHS